MFKTQRIAVVATIVFSLPFSGCDSTPQATSVAPAKLVLRGAGSTFVAPLYRKWFEQFQTENPTMAVEYDAVGSREGTKRFLAEAVDFGASDSALTNEQIQAVKRGALMLPVTAGSIVLAYNPEGMPDQLRLSRAVYADIFLGKITRWDDPRIAALNPGFKLPAHEMVVVVRGDGSGTTFAFTNHLATVSELWKNGPGVGQSVAWPPHTLPANGNEGVAGDIKRTSRAIGYVEYGIAKQAHLPMAVLENKAGAFVEPTATSGLDSVLQAPIPADFRMFMPDPAGPDSYPIVTFSWMLLYRDYPDSQKQDAVRKLARWCLVEGQQRSELLGYIRLPPPLVEKALAAIKGQNSSSTEIAP